MSWSQSWQTVLGTAALLATLALTSPGVNLARAGEGDAPGAVEASSPSPVSQASKPDAATPPAEGPTCPAAGLGLDEQSDRVVLRVQQEVARAAAAAAASTSEPSSSQADGVALNNRGYNYSSRPVR